MRLILPGIEVADVAGGKTPLAFVLDEGVGEEEAGVEGVAAGDSLGVGDGGDAMHPGFHLAVLKDFVGGIFFCRLGDVVGPGAHFRAS